MFDSRHRAGRAALRDRAARGAAPREGDQPAAAAGVGAGQRAAANARQPRVAAQRQRTRRRRPRAADALPHHRAGGEDHPRSQVRRRGRERRPVITASLC